MNIRFPDFQILQQTLNHSSPAFQQQMLTVYHYLAFVLRV